jgi:hypothetical protein
MPAVARFRYRGPIPWERIYKSSAGFFRSRRYDFFEINYKDKTNEFEGEWRAELKVDEYNMIWHTIKFKVFDLTPAVKDGENVYIGKIRLDITSGSTQNYDVITPAGKVKIFDDKQGWLKNMYDKLMFRDRENKIEGTAMVTGQQYLDHLKAQCNMEARA